MHKELKYETTNIKAIVTVENTGEWYHVLKLNGDELMRKREIVERFSDKVRVTHSSRIEYEGFEAGVLQDLIDVVNALNAYVTQALYEQRKKQDEVVDRCKFLGFEVVE